MSTTKAQRAAKAKAALEAASQAQREAFRGTFGLIPATATEYTCEGACGELKGLRSFPTTSAKGGLEATQRRTSECRACRNSRQGRAEKAAAKVLAEAKAKAAQAAKVRTPRKPRAAKASTAGKATVEATAAA